MAVTPPQEKFFGESVRTTQSLMALYGTLVELDALWAVYGSQMTDAAFEGVARFNGITATNLADAEFALSSVKNTMANAIIALSILKNMPD